MYPRRRVNKYTKYVQNICSLQCFCLIQENFRHRVIEVRWGVGRGGGEEMIVRLRRRVTNGGGPSSPAAPKLRRNAEDQAFSLPPLSSQHLSCTKGRVIRLRCFFWRKKYSNFFSRLLQRYSPYLMLDLIPVLRGGPWGSPGPSGWGGTPDAWTAGPSSPRTPSLPPSYADTLPSGSGSSLEGSTNSVRFCVVFFFWFFLKKETVEVRGCHEFCFGSAFLLIGALKLL